jgi:carboxyl-terminal processing protease
MIQRYLSRKHSILLLAATSAMLLVSFQLFADPTPGKYDRVVAEAVCKMLQRGHLSRPEMNEELSRKFFHRFLKDLDPVKLYFLKSDIEEFKKSESDLCTALVNQGDLSFAYTVYERYVARMAERVKLVEELVKAPQDFTIKEYMETDGEKLDYANTADELKDRWRKRIKFDLLLQRLEQKPVPDAEARKRVVNRYRSILRIWKQFDNYDLMERYLSDLASTVDPHSSYMSPNTLDDFDIGMRLNLEGIGALLRSDNGQTVVAEIVPGGAAAKDGHLKPNDKIVGVAQGDDQWVDVSEMRLRDVVKLIRGHKGTKVELKVIPAQKLEPVVYSLTRQKIELKSQEARQEIIDLGKKSDGTPYRLGVIDLPSFYADMAAARAGKSGYKSATEDVRKILQDFNAKGVDAVVLDLRHNPGGALNEALGLTGLFIDQGPLVQVKGSQGAVQHGDDPEKGILYAGPLVVLISRFSASASEILAGALQDYGRALIVGDSSTHGKGTVQTVIDLASRIQLEDAAKLGALKLTIQQFYRVNGDSTQNRGVTPDIVVPSITEGLSSGEKELDNALAFDHVAPIEHEELGMVPGELKTSLKERSAERVKKSADFQKLVKELDTLKARHDQKRVSLNEEELKAQFTKDEAQRADQKADGVLPQDPPDGGTYKFEREKSFANKEILQIVQDLLQSKKLISSR